MHSRLPPGPKTPALAQLASYIASPYQHFSALRDRYGAVFTMRLPGLGEQVVVASADGLKQLVTGSYDELSREASTLRFVLGGHALIFEDGLKHRRLRNLMTPPFHGDRMRGYGPVMTQVTDRILGALAHPEAPAPLQPIMQEITLEVILHCVFGLSEGARFERMKRLMVEFLDDMFTPWAFTAALLISGERVLGALERLGRGQRGAAPDAAPEISRLPIQRTADRLGAIDAMLFEEIERCRESGEGREDILSLLVSARDERGHALTRDELRDQLIMLLLAGHETTSNSLCWALLQLCQRPDVVAEIRREHAQVFSDGFDPLRVRELHYLGAVIQETMRLMPIAVGVARRLKKELLVDGYRLPAGTVTVPCSYLAQRDPKLWERPEEFDPTRFLHKKVSMAAHFPFGAGVWRCLGAAFADYEMRVVLSRLLSRFDVRLAPGESGRPILKGVTIAPLTGLRVSLVPLS